MFRTRSFVVKIILIILNKLVGFTEEFHFISFWWSRDTNGIGRMHVIYVHVIYIHVKITFLQGLDHQNNQLMLLTIALLIGFPVYPSVLPLSIYLLAELLISAF